MYFEAVVSWFPEGIKRDFEPAIFFLLGFFPTHLDPFPPVTENWSVPYFVGKDSLFNSLLFELQARNAFFEDKIFMSQTKKNLTMSKSVAVLAKFAVLVRLPIEHFRKAKRNMPDRKTVSSVKAAGNDTNKP